MIPVLITLPSLIFPGRKVRMAANVLLFSFVLIGSMSIGMFDPSPSAKLRGRHGPRIRGAGIGPSASTRCCSSEKDWVDRWSLLS